MTKLESCVRMLGAMLSAKAMVAVGLAKDGTFEAEAFTGLGGTIECCRGSSLDEAVSKLHAALCVRVGLARQVIEATDA